MKTKQFAPVHPSLADGEKLLHPDAVKAALGFLCRTNHPLRSLELRGLLRPVRLGTRTLRYSVEDVRAFIAQARGGAS